MIILSYFTLSLLAIFILNIDSYEFEFSSLSYNSLWENTIALNLLACFLVYIFIDIFWGSQKQQQNQGNSRILNLFLPSRVILYLATVHILSFIIYARFNNVFSRTYLINTETFDKSFCIVITYWFALFISINIRKYHKLFSAEEKLKAITNTITQKQKNNSLPLNNSSSNNSKNNFLNIFHNKTFINQKVVPILLFSSLFFSFITLGGTFVFWEAGIREGGREASGLIRALVPFASVFNFMVVLCAGLMHHKTKYKIINYLIVAIVSLPRVFMLSRAAGLPIILYILAMYLSPFKDNLPNEQNVKKVKSSSKDYLTFGFLALGILMTVSAFFVRTLDKEGGLVAYLNAFSTLSSDSVVSFRYILADALLKLSMIGPITQCVYFKSQSTDFLSGFFTWLMGINPLPSFLFAGTFLYPEQYITTVGNLLSITRYGITMPVLGEIYYRMGSFGIIAFPFVVGSIIGNLERKIILSFQNAKQMYWYDILLLLATIMALIRSLHGNSRTCTRYFFYTLFLIWIINSFLKYRDKKKALKERRS